MPAEAVTNRQKYADPEPVGHAGGKPFTDHLLAIMECDEAAQAFAAFIGDSLASTMRNAVYVTAVTGDELSDLERLIPPFSMGWRMGWGQGCIEGRKAALAIMEKEFARPFDK